MYAYMLLACLATLAPAEPTSENDERLAQLLRRQPAADAGRDGVLTLAEARAYRTKLQAAQPNSDQAGRARQSAQSPAPTHAEVSYGPHERNVLDLYLAESERPTPLVIYIHGGGFVGGDKRSVSPQMVLACREAGVSVAALNYRFVTTAMFPAPQQDCARAVQFLRHHAKRYNLDPARLAAYGGSAGAGISMWLAFRDDLAQPDSEDPIARQSTRLTAVATQGGQTSYDPNVIKEWIGGRAHEHPSIYKCYGLEKLEQMADPKLQPLYDEVSAIKHLTKDDPPIYMIYGEPDAPLPAGARPGQGIHHPIFGHKLKAEMDKLGIESLYHHTATAGRDRGEGMAAWLIRKLKEPRE